MEHTLSIKHWPPHRLTHIYTHTHIHYTYKIDIHIYYIYIGIQIYTIYISSWAHIQTQSHTNTHNHNVRVISQWLSWIIYLFVYRQFRDKIHWNTSMNEDCRCESFQWTLFQSSPQKNLLLSREAQYVRIFCTPKGQKLKARQTEQKIKFQFRALLASFMKLHQNSCYPSFGKVAFSVKKHLRVGIQLLLEMAWATGNPFPSFRVVNLLEQCTALSCVVLLFPVTALSLGDSLFAHSCRDPMQKSSH